MLGVADCEPEKEGELLGVAERDEDVDSVAFVVADTVKVARGLAVAEPVALELAVAELDELDDLDALTDGEERGELVELSDVDDVADAVVLFTTVCVTVGDDDLDDDVEADHVGQKEKVPVGANEAELSADTDMLRDAVTHAVADRERDGETVGERDGSATDGEPELVTDGDDDDESESEGEGVPDGVPTVTTVTLVPLTSASAALSDPEGVDVCEMLSVGDAE